jgi:hypothetical protein
MLGCPGELGESVQRQQLLDFVTASIDPELSVDVAQRLGQES